MPGKSVADIIGPWIDSQWQTSLILRCKQYWNVPVEQLPDLAVATFLEQRFATDLMIEEAQRRLALAKPDDTEFFDGQLRQALEKALARPSR